MLMSKLFASFVKFFLDKFCINLSQTLTNVTHQVKKDRNGIAKSIDPGQPAQFAQVDHGQNFSPLADFSVY